MSFPLNNINFEEKLWFEEEGEVLAQRIFDQVRDIDDGLVSRQQLILDISLLYGDSAALVLNSSLVGIRPEMRHNVLAGAVDTVVAEVIQSHRRPVVMSRRGNYKSKFKCKKATMWLDTLRRDNRRCVSHAARDAVLTGLGTILVTEQDGKPNIERVWPGNVIFDDRSCVDSLPRSVFIRRYVDRRVLIRKYAKNDETLAQAIREAPQPNPAYAWTLPSYNGDLVEVIIAYRLPSGEGANDGLVAVCIENCTLNSTKWTKQRYPLVFIRPIPPQIGFWGESIAKRAKPAQEELDKLILRVQQAMHLVSVPRVYVKRGPGGIPKGQLVNNVGVVIPVDEPPTFSTPQAMNDEIYNHIDRLERYIYATIGVSQMSAQSMKPLGLDSGAALRAFADIQSRRFIQLEESVAEATMDLAELCMDIMRESGGTVVFQGSRGMKEIDFSEIDPGEEDTQIVLSVSNALPVEFAGRVQILEEQFKSGTIDAYDYWSHIDNPDFEAIRDRYCAPKDLIEKMLDEMLETGEYNPPEPTMALQAVGIPLAVQKLQQAILDGADENEVEPLRTWLTQAQDILDEIQKQAAEQQAQMNQDAQQQLQQQAQQQQAQGAAPSVPGPPVPPPIAPGPTLPANLPPGQPQGL